MRGASVDLSTRSLRSFLFTFQEDPERTSHPNFTVHLDLASGVVYDPFNKVKPDSAAFHMVVEPFEHSEYFILLIAAYAQAIVLHMQYYKSAELSAANMNDRIAVRMLVFDGIREEII